MRRREFIAGLGGAAAWPLAARAQRAAGLRRVGVLMYGDANDLEMRAMLAAFGAALAKLGRLEGRNVLIERRFGDNDVDGIRARAAELVKLMPEVIVTTGGGTTFAARANSQTIPIVVVGAGNPIVNNIASPEGNVTGFTILYPSLGERWLQLLREVAPHLARVAVIGYPQTPDAPLASGDRNRQYRASIAEAAQALGVNAIITEFRNDSKLERAIDTFADQPEGGLIALPGPQTRSHHSRQLMAQLAARYRLPAIHWDQTFPVDGGLMSYGGDWGDLISSAASYVDRILHGTKVSELPFQYPTRFKFIINLKTAKALSLTVPPTLLALADEVIQ